MGFYEIVGRILNEGYLKLTTEANNFLREAFIPKLKETTLNYQNVLVFDIVKAAKSKSYDDVHLTDLGGHLSYDFWYKLNYINSDDDSLTVWIVYTNLRKSASAEFQRLEKTIIVYIPCVSVVGNNEMVSNLEDSFKNKSFDTESLAELEKEFKESLRDIDKTYLNHMLRGATFKTTINNIEHELIHAIDPASYQSKDDSEESLEKHRDQYMGDYYGTPEQNAGNIPAEFNPFFWNIVRSFEVPLNNRTQQFLLDFIKNPQPLITKLKLLDIESFNTGKIFGYFLQFFNKNDKDYISFIKILNNKHHRKLLIRIFQDPYLRKKFSQKLYSFVQTH